VADRTVAHHRTVPEIPSERKREVLRLVAAGYANKEIAVRLGITSWGVEKHLRQLFRRYAVPNRTALVLAAYREGHLS
jgi:DNA-binding CsgD family transcriptional regulator